MAGFLLNRLLQAAFVVVVVTLIVSFAVRLTGDPALMIASGATEITEADLARIREGLGLNQPFLTQYLHTLSGLFTWDFGNSFLGGTPVATLIGALKHKGLKRGVASLCIGGGEGTAVAIELV